MADAGDPSARLDAAEKAAAAYRRQATTALETVRQVCRTLELSETTRRKLLDALLAAEAELETLRAASSKVNEVQRAAKLAMESAEAVRREGVEALEEARALKRKTAARG